MMRISNYREFGNTYKSNSVKSQSSSSAKSSAAVQKGYTDTSMESKLSVKAQEYLEKLRSEHDDMDFVIADLEHGDSAEEIFSKCKRPVNVIMSSDDIEKMARDEKYAAEKMQTVQTTVNMAIKICEQEGFLTGKANKNTGDQIINSLGAEFKDDGSVSLFAEMSKAFDKQKEQLDKLAEKRAANKKTYPQANSKEKTSGLKKTIVKADTMENLIKNIKSVDWSKIEEFKSRKFELKV